MEKRSHWSQFLLDHRGFFVVVFVVPLSLIYDFFFRIRAWAVQKFHSAPERHDERIKEIANLIRQYNEQTRGQTKKKKLCTARGGWESISPGYRDYKGNSHRIPINLYDILDFKANAVDGNGKPQPYVRVEPMVNMGAISRYLIPRRFTIPVLPEMDDLTVGGLFMGVGIETSSHLYGLFNDTVLEAEIITASGEVVTCSRTQNRDLFDALPWSYGTLGFLASVKLLVVPCKPYVRLEYYPSLARSEGMALIKQFTTEKNPAEFVEALQYSQEEMVVMRGEHADLSELNAEAGEEVNSIGHWYKPWFYKHVETFLRIKSGNGKVTTESSAPIPVKVEFVPLRDYYHRHTKSIFWELDLILQPLNGNNPIFRVLFGWALPPKVSFLKLTTTGSMREMYEREHVIQDMLVPLDKSEEGLAVFHREYNVYPLWICPFRLYDYGSAISPSESAEEIPHRCFLRKPPNATLMDDKHSRLHNLSNGKKYQIYLDLGAYGVPKAVLLHKPFDIVRASRSVESWVASVGGFQMLYADSYLEKDEFKAMFDHTHYEAMKEKYDPSGNFPEVYDKASVKITRKAEHKKHE